jgi:mono/diheme cytochrome c family protein
MSVTRRNLLLLVISPVMLAGALTGTFSAVTLHAQREVLPQPADARIWTGVYSTAQARRGQAAFAAYCSRCHGPDLAGRGRGGGGGPALKGDPFWMSWEAATLGSLAMTIQDTMPRDAPGSLADEMYGDLVAYILEANAFPAGDADLELKPAVLETIKIAIKDGVKEIPNFALVQTLGCLARGPNNVWLLTNVSEPIVTKDESPRPAQLKDADSRAPGTETLRLVGAGHFKPEAHTGHRMEARGLLNKVPDDHRLDLTSLQMVSASCPN